MRPINLLGLLQQPAELILGLRVWSGIIPEMFIHFVHECLERSILLFTFSLTRRDVVIHALNLDL